MIERNYHDNEASCVNSQTTQERNEFNLFEMLKPSLQRDGNQWCVLYGKNLQECFRGLSSLCRS